MSKKINAGIVGVSKFTCGSSKKFATYIKYMDRIESQRTVAFSDYNLNPYDGYNHYMDNPEKTSALFSSASDALDLKQKQTLKGLFQQAQENDSVMWQDVISFDNKWLEKHHYYDRSTGILQEEELKEAVRTSVQKVLENEGMEQSAIWSAAIHYNTDNIHVHVATVEPTPTREYRTYTDKKTKKTYQARKGYRHASTLDVMKATVVSKLIDRSDERQKISKLTRERFVPADMKFRNLYQFHLSEQYQKIYEALPEDRRLWKYNMNALSEVRPLITQFVEDYIDYYHAEDFEELIQRLDDEVLEIEEIYGKGTKQAGRSDQYKADKIDELKANLGNVLLKDLLEFSHQGQEHSQKNKQPTSGHFHQSLVSLGKVFQQKHVHQKNQRLYREHTEDRESRQR